MVPRPSPIRPDCMPEILRQIAACALTERSRNKYLLLASLQEGSILIEELPPKEQQTALRYIREINEEPSIEALLNPQKGGPKPKIREDISPATMRKEAAQASGKYENGLLTFAEIVEKKNLAAGAALGLISPDHIKRLLPLFNEYGMDGLRQLKLTKQDAAVLAKILRETPPPAGRETFEALLITYHEKLTPSAVEARFGIKPSNLDGHIRKFKVHGRLAFVGVADRKAEKSMDIDAARRLQAASEKAFDDVTRSRCSAVSGVLRGEKTRSVAEAHGLTVATVTRLVKAFRTNGLPALLGEREFRRPPGREVSGQIRDAVREETEPKRAVALAAADFYDGARIEKLKRQYDVAALELFALLYAMQEAGFRAPASIVREHLQQRLEGGAGEKV